MVAAPIAFRMVSSTLTFYPTLGRIFCAKPRPDLVHIDEEPYNLATAHAVWLARRMGMPSLFFTWQNLERRYPPPFRWFERYVYGQVASSDLWQP